MSYKIKEILHCHEYLGSASFRMTDLSYVIKGRSGDLHQNNVKEEIYYLQIAASSLNIPSTAVIPNEVRNLHPFCTYSPVRHVFLSKAKNIIHNH